MDLENKSPNPIRKSLSAFSLKGSFIHGRSSKAGGSGKDGHSSRSEPEEAVAPMSEDRAALMLQAKYRQHKAWVQMRAMRIVRVEQDRLTSRGPNWRDPLGMLTFLPIDEYKQLRGALHRMPDSVRCSAAPGRSSSRSLQDAVGHGASL